MWITQHLAIHNCGSTMSEDSDYVCTLDQASIKKAKEELHENPQDRSAAVQAFRDWVKEQPHIKYPNLDTITVLKFLRGAKFSQMRAREMFEKNLELRSSRPKWFKDVDTHEVELMRIVKFGYMVPVHVRNKKGELLLIQRLGKFEGHKFEPANLFRLGTVLFEYLMNSEMTQVNGLVFLQDFTGVGPKLLSKLLNKEVADFQKAWVKVTPGRFKGFHYYNAGLLFETVMTFARPFLPKKWIERIQTHDTLETVYKSIPMECLPVEYLPDDYTGPNAGSVDQLLEKFIQDIQESEFRSMMLRKSSAEYGFDQSKRSQQETVTQHFRKLNVD